MPHVKLPTNDEIEDELYRETCERLDSWIRTRDFLEREVARRLDARRP